MDNTILEDCLPSLGTEFIAEIKKFGTVKTYLKNEFIVKQGQFMRNLPIVLTGSVKVYTNEEDIQFLLYYIQHGESCIFSFAHLFGQDTTDFSAVPEKKTEILLLPIEKVKEWILRFPTFNSLIITEFQKHYNELLQATKQIICYKLEDRLLIYLRNKSTACESRELSISHKNVAADLGTSRVVISRLMKKLEIDGKVFQDGRKIKIL